MERQHAEGRGRRDRRIRESFAFLGRAFPGRTAGADLPAFLHETSIVIQEPGYCESSTKLRLSSFYPSLDYCHYRLSCSVTTFRIVVFAVSGAVPLELLTGQTFLIFGLAGCGIGILPQATGIKLPRQSNVSPEARPGRIPPTLEPTRLNDMNAPGKIIV
jgi:hypothetical protein